MNFFNLFSRSSAEADEENQASYPDTERARDVHLPGDDYDDLQHVLKNRDNYSEAAEYARAKTFVEKNGWMKPASNVGIVLGHTISATTAIGFSCLAAYHFTNVNTNPSAANIAVAVVTGLVLLLLVLLVETGKINGESALFQAVVFKRAFPASRKWTVLVLILLSLGISAGGGHLAGLYWGDNSRDIQDEFSALNYQAVSRISADSASLAHHHRERLAQDRKTIAQWQEQVKDLRSERVMWKGRLTMPERNRKPANLLLQKIADKEGEISRYTEQFNEDLRAIRDDRKQTETTFSSGLDEALTLDGEKAFRYGLIAVLVVLIVELISLVAHWMKAWYLRGVYQEGRATSMIEVQAQRQRISLEALLAQQMSAKLEQMTGQMERLQRLQPGPPNGQHLGYQHDQDQGPRNGRVNRYKEQRIGFKQGADNVGNEMQGFSQGNSLHQTTPTNEPQSMHPSGQETGQGTGQQTRHETVRESRYLFVGNQPFDAQDNTGKRYQKSKRRLQTERKIKRAWLKLQQQHGEPPSIKAVSDKTGINRNTVSQYLKDLQLIEVHTETQTTC